MLGLFIGLCYLPSWVRFLLGQLTVYGSGSFTLAICLVTIAVVKLCQQRQYLATIQPLEADRWIGYGLIITGIFLFPFCRFALWPQALLWLTILGGIALSCWGTSFLCEYPGVCWAVALSAYPNPGHIFGILWQILLPAQGLESSMAWVATFILQWLGHPVIASGPLMVFPHHTVTVGWGCSGFDMALAMIGASVWLGFYLNFSSPETLQLTCIGVALAFLFNIPRLVLMALAAVYWATDVFEFWHGAIGGQVFVGALFLSYYYCVLGLSPHNRRSIR
jgi:exosortase/archaeosortase family protein